MFDTLVDTGSPNCFINVKFFNSYFSSLPVMKSRQNFCTVSGDDFYTLGSVLISISGFRNVVIQEFHIIDSPINLILSIDALHKLEARLDFSINHSISEQENILVASVEKARLSEEDFLNLFDLSSSSGSADEINELKALLIEFRDIFSEGSFDIGSCTMGYHDIITGNAQPVYQKPYRTPHALREVAKGIVNDMLDNGIIEESQSAWCSPFILIDKPDGTKRFVVDYRKLNSVTQKDRIQMPNIEELLDRLSACRSFSLLDLTSGFWQIPLTEEAKPKTAFSILNNQYQFRVMPFGLCCAPQTFQRTFQNVVKGLPTTPYIDDLLVPTKNNKEQLSLLRTVFVRLRSANFKVKPNKCSFLMRRVQYLGYIVEDGKLSPNPTKISAIKEFPLPQSTKELQRFLGLCNYFGRFVKNFAELASPLTSLQNSPAKSFKQNWNKSSDELFQSFEKLKKVLSNDILLKLPDLERSYSLDVDASDVAVGAVLYQDNGPVAYYSHKLNQAQKNYSATDKEFLALHLATQRFRPYLLGNHFSVFTDHKPLTSLVYGKSYNSRQARWQMELQEYDFDLLYKSGITNVAADALSRICVSAAINLSLSDKIKSAQLVSDEVKDCVTALNDGRDPVLHNELSAVVKKCKLLSLDSFTVKDSFLFHLDRLVVPREEVDELVSKYHKCGHFSGNKTQESILERFWFPHVRAAVRKVITECGCAVSKSYGHNPSPSRFPVVQPFEVVSVDIVSLPFSRGFSYLLTAIDMSSRWLVAVPLPNMEADMIVKAFLNSWIYIYGPPAVIHSDQGSQFVSDVFKSMMERFSISSSNSSVYHPNGNSIIERAHRTLKDRLRVCDGHWSDNLKQCVFDCNRISGAFSAVFHRSAVPICDWPTSSDFLQRPNSKSGPQENDWVCIRNRKARNTLAPRFGTKHRIKKRFGNSVVLEDGRQVNLHDVVLVGKSDGGT